jgi:hypothetical protein
MFATLLMLYRNYEKRAGLNTQGRLHQHPRKDPVNRLMKLEIHYQNLWKFVQWDLSCCIWTEVQTDMMEVVVAFCSFVNVPKSVQCKYLPVVRVGHLSTGQDHTRIMFWNRVVRGLFVSDTAGMTRAWRELHSDELPDTYFSVCLIKLIKLKWIS